MFRTKVCGVTNAADAAMVAAVGADAIGLNFYPGSPRYVAPEHARAIVAAIPRRVVKVGLFVDAPVDEMCRTFDELGLDLIQLHGGEPPEVLASLGGRPMMRAFRLGENGLAPIRAYLDACRRLHCLPGLALIDAHVPGTFGGTGQVADWQAAETYSTRHVADGFPPLVLAGGLTPQNVAEAVRAVRPTAVDTASGVESSPGHKDPVAVAAFVRAALEAFADA